MRSREEEDAERHAGLPPDDEAPADDEPVQLGDDEDAEGSTCD